MTLADLIERLDDLDERMAIYAAPRWTASSRALAATDPGDGRHPTEACSMTYLVTVAEAKRVIAVRRSVRPDLTLTTEQRCEAVIYFATYDHPEPLPSVVSGEIRLPA